MPGLPACLAWACPSNELASMLLPSCCPHSQDQSERQTQEEKAWQATSMGQEKGDLL